MVLKLQRSRHISYKISSKSMSRSKQRAIRGDANQTQVADEIQSLLSEAGITSDISRITKLASLWSGYGTVWAVETSQDSPNNHQYLAIKQVNPPANEQGVSHSRKLHSYHVEAAFYTQIAPQIIQHNVCNIPRPLYVSNNLTDTTTTTTTSGTLALILTDIRPSFPINITTRDLDLPHAKAALTWLAGFHSLYWGRPPPPELWSPEGCFWHLDTRQDELSCMSDRDLQQAAPVIDRLLKMGGSPGCEKFRTIVHGDFKAANLAFSNTTTSSTTNQPPVCCAYDFQYCGGGLGAKDVAYLLCSSVSAAVVGKYWKELLHHYHAELTSRLRSSISNGTSTSNNIIINREAAAEEYTIDVLEYHFRLCIADFVRFMNGWGYWGNSSWANSIAAKFLKEELEGRGG
jgi:hypothetical protein